MPLRKRNISWLRYLLFGREIIQKEQREPTSPTPLRCLDEETLFFTAIYGSRHGKRQRPHISCTVLWVAHSTCQLWSLFDIHNSCTDGRPRNGNQPKKAYAITRSLCYSPRWSLMPKSNLYHSRVNIQTLCKFLSCVLAVRLSL